MSSDVKFILADLNVGLQSNILSASCKYLNSHGKLSPLSYYLSGQSEHFPEAPYIQSGELLRTTDFGTGPNFESRKILP